MNNNEVFNVLLGTNSNRFFTHKDRLYFLGMDEETTKVVLL